MTLDVYTLLDRRCPPSEGSDDELSFGIGWNEGSIMKPHLFAVLGLLALVATCESLGLADDVAPHYLQLREADGQLVLESCLSEGTTSLSGNDERGRLVRANIAISQSGSEAKRVRIFRFTQTLKRSGSAATRAEADGFTATVTMSPTTNPDHYAIRFRCRPTSIGQHLAKDCILGRTCCGYYLKLSSDPLKPRIIRGSLFSDLRSADRAGFGEFQEIASACSCPGFDFQCGSLVSGAESTAKSDSAATQALTIKTTPLFASSAMVDPRAKPGGELNLLPSRPSHEWALAKAEVRMPIFTEKAPSHAKPAAADHHRPIWTLTEGMGAPAGVVYDPRTRELYVSQISGEGDKKDGDGLVSRIDLQGRIIKLAWVAGLNAPKGLALSGDTLWATDIDELVEINVGTGKIRRKFAIDGAKFLTGVAVDAQGVVYVGDMLTSRVYRVEHGVARIFLEDRSLESPGALLMSDNRLLIAGWGYTTDYTTPLRGSIFSLDLKTRVRREFSSEPRGNWFGLCRGRDSEFLAADFSNGQVYRIDAAGRSTCLLHLPQGCAGIAYVADADLLVVTETRENRIAGYALTTGAKRK